MVNKSSVRGLFVVCGCAERNVGRARVNSAGRLMGFSGRAEHGAAVRAKCNARLHPPNAP